MKGSSVMNNVSKEILSQCSELVLCKEELFFQTKNGKSLTSWYPVGKEAASVCSLFFDIPLSYEGGDHTDNEAIIDSSFE